MPSSRAVAGLEQLWAAVPYEGEARELIAALKFRRLLPLARVAAEVMAVGIPAHLAEATIVPVPPAPARLRSRGLDPAEEIAAALGCLIGAPVARCLGRGNSQRQVGRPRSERLADPPSFLPLAHPPAFALLVDDVATTGATLCACAGTLRRAGAARIAAVSFASAERESTRVVR